MIDLVVPTSVAELREVSSEGCLIAGGTDLLVQMRAGRDEERLIDISNLDDGPPAVCEQGDKIEISALCPISQIITALSGALPAVSAAAAVFASLQIRNRATIGGNLANGSPAADMVPPLVVASAVATVEGPEGSRQEPVSELASGPGRNTLRVGEWISSLRVLRPAGKEGFRKLGGRFGMTISIVNLAWRWGTDEHGALFGVRLVAGAVAPTVIRCERAEQEIEGNRVTEVVLRRAVAAIRADISPIDDVRATAWYRREAIGGLLEEALLAHASPEAGDGVIRGA
ncbi:MAG: FAD binding domain-containing protein [Acidimicrobiales bacterium]